ncbi:MAG: electron transfer flavoprotein subunit alpha/FixB family protein [Anaerolineales bacterium]
MSGQIWVYIDHFNGKPLPASWEVVSAARKLASEAGIQVVALIFGQNGEVLAKSAFHYGADEVLLAEDSSLADYRPEPFASLISSQAKSLQPDAVFFPTSTRGRELAAMAAIDLDTGVLPDVIEIKNEGGQFTALRPIYAGKLLVRGVCQSKPQILTLRVRAFGKPVTDESRSGKITKVEPAISENEIQTKVVDYATVEGRVSLGDASIIVSGGRGTSNNPNLTPPTEITDEKQKEIWRAQQGFKMIGELAETISAAVGASRAAVDAGYVPYAHQVGQTGKVVSPDLYIALGISGAIQHLAGMRTSKVIVAINKDPDAPIFKMARYGVVGDLYEVVPALTKAFKEKLGK